MEEQFSVLSDTAIKYGAPKTEMFAVVTFVEKYRAYLGTLPLSYAWTTERYPGSRQTRWIRVILVDGQ